MQTSLEQIAETAGVTRGAIYWHFADKVALFKALHERVRLPQEDMVRQAAVEGHPDPLGFVEQIALDCIKTITTDQRLMRVYSILLVRCEYVGEMKEALRRQQDADAAMSENFARIFALARDNGSLSDRWTPGTAARVFELMLRGLWTDWLRHDQNFDLMEAGSRCLSELFVSLRSTNVSAKLTPVEGPAAKPVRRPKQ